MTLGNPMAKRGALLPKPVTLAPPHIVRPSVQPPEALGVSAPDALDVHLQDQLKPRPQQGKHLFPVPVGFARIRDSSKEHRGGVGVCAGTLTGTGAGGCESWVWKQEHCFPADTQGQGQWDEATRSPRVRAGV